MTRSDAITTLGNACRQKSRRLLAFIVVGCSTIAPSRAQTRYTVTDLGVLPGATLSVATGLNDGGDVVGYCSPSPDNSDQAMNGLGQVAGESHPPFGSRPVIWTNDAAHTPVGLPLRSGDNYGAANAINDLGRALGSSACAVPGIWNVGPARLVVWRDGGVYDLNGILGPSTGAGRTLITANAINNIRQIVGLGIHNGNDRAYLLTPAVP